MRHQHHIACLVVVVVESKEVNLAEHSPSADNAFAVDEKVVAQNIDKGSSIGNFSSRSNGRIQWAGNRLPAVLFQDLDDRRWLTIMLVQ